MEPSYPRSRRARGHRGVSRVPESTPIYGLAVGPGEAGAAEGDGDGAGDGEGVGSGGHAEPSLGCKVMTSVTPFRSISFDSWAGAQTRAFWPRAPVVRSMTSWPQGSLLHFASTLVP